MTGRTDLDREMTAYLEARSTSRTPEGLLENALARVGTTRQRPGWLIPERWVPDGAGRVARIRTAAVVIAIVALLLGIAFTVGVFVGSQRRLPLPFGIATPGLVAFDVGGDIYVANAYGTDRTQLTFGPDLDDHATWSPDGTMLAYESEQAADLSTALIVIGADGLHPTILADHLVQAGNITWSPDSRRLAISSRIAGQNAFHIYVAEADRSGIVPLGGPDLFGVEPNWSPDGTTIAFKRVAPCCGGPPDALWLVGSDGSHPRQLSSTTGSAVALWHTAWSPDGRRLAFVANGNGVAQDLYVINADGTGERNISDTPENESWPSWSPDGTRIAFARMSNELPDSGTMVVVSADGSHAVALAGQSVNSNPPVWSPDGTRVLGYVYRPNIGSQNAIAVFDASGHVPPIITPDMVSVRFLGDVGPVFFSTASWQRVAP
jgi:TolB protein